MREGERNMRDRKKRILSILTALALALGLCTPLGGLVPKAEAASSPKLAAPVLDDFLVPVSQVTKVPTGYTGVYTATDLLAISDAPNGNYILMADIDLSGYDWTPLCNDSEATFTGVFEGNGHVISSLNGVNGLFSYTAAGSSGAEIRNLGIENASIHAQYENQWSGIIGGSVAYAKGDTTISNCYFQGDIDSNANMIGGIVGNHSNEKPVEYCWMAGSIRSTNAGSSYNEPLVGGIIGQSNYSNLTITGCIHSGSIETSGYATYVGGISGMAEGTISNCQNYGSITQYDQYANIGGIVSGLWTPEIESCMNAADIQMVGNGAVSRSRLGGITATTANISNCFNCGDITADGASYVGGITAENGHADNSYNVGYVHLDNPATAGALAGAYGCGALFGEVMGISSNCYYLAGDLPAYEKVNGTPTLNNIRSLTADQMKNSGSFGGFNFDSVWTMGSGSYLYPVLKSMDLSGGSTTQPPSGAIPTPILDEPTCTEEGVSLSWTLPLEVPDKPHTVDGFYILRKTAGGSYQRVGQVGEYDNLYTDTSVQEGQTYTYTIQAYYQDQTGDYDQTGKTITFTRPVTVPVTVEVRNVEFRIEGGKNGLNTDTLWMGAQSKVYIYIKEDAGIEHGSDPGYVVLMDRESGAQLWRSDTIHYYTSSSIAESHHFDFVFRPEDCVGGYLPSGREIQFRIMDDTGKEILTYNCETFPLQLWSFGNPNSPFDQAFLEQFYSESRAKAIFKAAKSDTLGGDGLCVGMSLLVSLINSDGIGDIGFSGCTELGQVQKDTPLTGSMKGYTALDLIKACQARQYFDSIIRQRKENREDLTGLIDAVESYERGIGAMPVVIISVPQEGASDYVHALAAYAAEPDGKGNMRIDVYDPNHPDIIGSYILIYNYESSDPFWVYREQFRGGEGELKVQGGSLIDDVLQKYGLTYFTSRSYPMQQEDDIWVSIAGYDFSTLKDGGLDITVFDPNRFQGLNAAWVSGQGTLSLSSLTAQAEIADDETFYTIDADGGSTDLTLKEGLDSVHVTGEGTLTITCAYEGENGTVSTRFSGTAKDGVRVNRTDDTVRFSGGESGTVTVTYENGKTWTEQVEPGKDLSVTADGKNEPSTGGKNEPSTGDKNESSTNGTVSQKPDSVRFFDDISSDDYFYDAVVWAVENGITTGTGANTFSPNRPCTRAEVVTFLWRSHFPTEVVMDGTDFRDVSSTSYYFLPVSWAVKEGITSGTGKDTFSPNMVCTRSQVVTFLYRYFGD